MSWARMTSATWLKPKLGASPACAPLTGHRATNQPLVSELDHVLIIYSLSCLASLLYICIAKQAFIIHAINRIVSPAPDIPRGSGKNLPTKKPITMSVEEAIISIVRFLFVIICLYANQANAIHTKIPTEYKGIAEKAKNPASALRHR